MAMARTTEFDALLTTPGVTILASYGYFRTRNGEQVCSSELRTLINNVAALQSMHKTMTPWDMAKVLNCPVEAIVKMFCKHVKGDARYNVPLATGDVHKMLSHFLTFNDA